MISPIVTLVLAIIAFTMAGVGIYHTVKERQLRKKKWRKNAKL